MNSSSMPIHLMSRAENEPIRLFGRIRQKLQTSFRRCGIRPLPRQMEDLETPVQELFTGTPGSATIAPLSLTVENPLHCVPFYL